MESFRHIIFMGLTILFSLALHAQTESQLTCRRYTTQDGLPQMQTERLWQDARGYIYAGTLSGFVRFDGREFTPFLKGRRLNIVGFAEVDGEVRALGFFRQWRVDYDETVAMPLDPQGHWLLNNLNVGSLPNGYVLMEDSLEQHRRLCLLTKHGLQPLLTDSLLDEMTPDRKLYKDPRTGDIIVPVERGVYRFRKSGQRTEKLTDRGDVYTLLRTPQALLVFTPGGIYDMADDSLRLVAEADWRASSYGLTVRELRDGSIIVADEHAVYLFDGQTVRPLAGGFNLIRDVLVDCWERLWVATYQGLYCYFNRCFTNHWLTDESDIVRAVAVGADGQLVMGTLNGKIFAGQRLISDDPEQFYNPSAVRLGDDVYMPGRGDVACITPDDSVRWLRLPPDRYQFVGKAWGKLITANRNSIFAYDTATATLDTLTTQVLHPWCSACDASGLLWIGSSSGLFSIDSTRHLQKAAYGRQKLIVTAIDADAHGNVFFASADSLFVVRHGNVSALNPQIAPLCGHEVRAVHASPHGYLVIAVVDGLFVCRYDDRCRLSDLQFFNHLNGFTMTEPLKAVMAETADGTVWLPGVEQMTSFRPADLLDAGNADTIISPPLQWWQHWWVWLPALLLLTVAVWAVTRWYEKRLARRSTIRLQREKMKREEQIEAIRQKAIEDEKASTLAQDIVRMAENAFAERLTLRTASGTIVAEVKDIAYFKGDGNYSLMVTFHDRATVLIGLGALAKMLNPDVFVRADRSTLVNIHYISALLPRQRRCLFRSPAGQETETTLLAPAFKRLQGMLNDLMAPPQKTTEV